MKHIKNNIFVIYLLAAVIFTAGLSSCASADTNDNPDGRLSVVTTIFPQLDFTREIAGDKANISMLLPPGAETHSFEPTAKDIIKIQKCDVFIYVGGESDSWVDRILSSMDTSHMKIITLMDCVEAVEEEIVEGMQAEDDGPSGDSEPEYDEHVWTSPLNAKLIVQKISSVLCEADYDNSDFYKQNAANYLSKLDELDKEFQNVVNNAKRKVIIFGDRFPFRYFALRYGLEYYAAFPGCSTETEANASTVKFLIDKINAEKIPVIFHIELSNEKMAEAISESTGAKVLLFHAVHNIAKTNFENGLGYLDFMKQNVENLKEALW